LTARRLNAPTAELVALGESWVNRGVPVRPNGATGTFNNIVVVPELYVVSGAVGGVNMLAPIVVDDVGYTIVPVTKREDDIYAITLAFGL
jgi:hypothetical protein